MVSSVRALTMDNRMRRRFIPPEIVCFSGGRFGMRLWLSPGSCKRIAPADQLRRAISFKR